MGMQCAASLHSYSDPISRVNLSEEFKGSALFDGCAYAMQAACKQSTAVGTDAVGLLSQQYFFTSDKLAKLATQAELLTKVSRDLFHAFPQPYTMFMSGRFCQYSVAARCH